MAFSFHLSALSRRLKQWFSVNSNLLQMFCLTHESVLIALPAESPLLIADS